MKIRRLDEEEFPSLLKHIPDGPEKLYIRGIMPSIPYIYLCVVGSRKHSPYGKEICQTLIRGLKGYPIVIVSGLALGIDSIAHEAAIDVGLKTMAFPGSGLDDKVLYPRTNFKLAQKIIENNGCLISEFEPLFEATIYSFPKRNRLMAGVSHAVLIIEAEEQSGTLITARMALDYNRDVLVVPGSVFSPCSVGSNDLIRDGATPITNSKELLEALGFTS